jgi:phage recombination protein Bet
MANKEIVATTPPAVQSWTPEQVELIKKTVANGASNDELALFLQVAKRSGLDPFTRQIHFVKRGDRATIQTGIDGYRAIAERTGTLAGIEDALYDSEDAPVPKKATVTVYKLVAGTRVGFTASARWNEYAPIYGGKLSPMWQKMPYLMLAKCAEALALRKAFPNDLSGLYTNEEMQQAERATYDTTPVADDLEIISTGDDTGEERERSAATSKPAVAGWEKGIPEKRAVIKKLLDQQSLVPLKSKDDYQDACLTITELELTPANYDAVIAKLTELQHEQSD